MVMNSPSFGSRVYGCLLGGALGDALGYPVETSTLAQIRSDYGPSGLTDFSQLQSPAHFSDDTQLTLYTVDGLVDALQWANEGVVADEAACLWLSYLRWLRTQNAPMAATAPQPPRGWLDDQEVMRHRRSPGAACLSGLATGEMGTVGRPVNPESKGCGTVMRSAPFGLVPYLSAEMIYRFSINGAALTHGHPLALHSAAAFSLLIHNMVHDGVRPADAVTATLVHLRSISAPVQDLITALERAVTLSTGPLLAPEQLTAEFGAGKVAEEALSLAVYAALVTESDATAAPEHFRAAVAVALNHGGDSDSIASITGNLLGAYYGEDALPDPWIEALEGADVVRAMAAALLKVTTAGDF